MPKKSSRRKRREARYQALRYRRAHPDFIDGGRLAGYRRFCVFVGTWRVICPLAIFSTLVAVEEVNWFWLLVVLLFILLSSPLTVHIVRLECFEWKLTCPHCNLPSPGRWHDSGGYERFSDIRPRRRYYRELKKATDTYTCPYCGKTIYVLPREEYKKIRGKGRKN